MRTQISHGEGPFSQDDGKVIYIVGPKRLQNETLAYCLEQEISAKCRIIVDPAAIPLPDLPVEANPIRLVMVDCQGKDPGGLLLQFKSGWQNTFSDMIAFFNTREDSDLEEYCLLEGVRGLFYEQDSLMLLTKGIQAIFNGQLWLSRDTMTRWLLEGSRLTNQSKRKAANLTKREAEILALVAVGDSNQEIADKLNISPHTVRTHVYNVFKKINVSNRLQATLWVARNL